jgi:hypothetical protein
MGDYTPLPPTGPKGHNRHASGTARRGRGGSSISPHTFGDRWSAPRAPNRPNPLTYPKADRPFDHALFKNPTAEYRGCPLWAWNAKLDKEALIRQIGYLKEMGFGGFHMHVRVGLDTEYMGSKFMETVKACVEEAEKQGMMACL